MTHRNPKTDPRPGDVLALLDAEKRRAVVRVTAYSGAGVRWEVCRGDGDGVAISERSGSLAGWRFCMGLDDVEILAVAEDAAEDAEAAPWSMPQGAILPGAALLDRLCSAEAPRAVAPWTTDQLREFAGAADLAAMGAHWPPGEVERLTALLAPIAAGRTEP